MIVRSWFLLIAGMLVASVAWADDPVDLGSVTEKHVMVPMRKIDGAGFAKKKDRPPDGTNPMKYWKADLDTLREGWANVIGMNG